MKSIEINKKDKTKTSKQKIASQSTLINENKSKSSQKGLPAGWIRATFIIHEKINEKVKALAYWERLKMKEVIQEALTMYLQNKNIKPIPKKDSICEK